jgi:DNA-binding transcriptional regulator YdaS (Cro superfamily)
MDLTSFIADRQRRASLAKACDTSPDYLWQIATGWKGRKPSARLARRIHDATHGLISLESMRPDVFTASNDS